MNKFINREDELHQLNTLYQRSGGQLVILYGRRRLGKTRLLKEFCANLPHVYFMADKAGEKSLRKSLALAMATSLDEPLLQNVDYPGWYDLFAAFDRFRAGKDKIVLILDEYQYICQIQPAFSSFVQKWWDEHWQHENIVLVLCGSVTSMMYKETLAQSSPLYGRATAQILLAPFAYTYLQDFLPDHNQNELVKFYALGGGVPRYLELLQNYSSFTTALDELVLNRSGLLYNEARYLLHEEISSPHTCWSILQAMGSGAGRISEIAGKLGLPANQLTHYLDLLRDLFLIYREVPVLEKNPAKSKKGYYQVADPFLRLWFGSIFPYESFLEFGQVDAIRKRLEPLITNHIAFCFEQLCRDYVRRHAIEYNCLQVGRQWAAHYEIDVAGVDPEGCLQVVGECKWSQRKVGKSIYDALHATVQKFNLPVAAQCKTLLFSRSGFTEELVDLAQDDESLVLITSLFD
jgi:AAA+ ATPase superfamily predicted ATPase